MVINCLITNIVAVAENSKLEIESHNCEGTGKLEKIDGKFMISEIELKPLIKNKEMPQTLMNKGQEVFLMLEKLRKKKISQVNKTILK